MKLCDIAVIFSHDTDLLPVPETLTRVAGAAVVETASWVSPTFRKRLRPKPAVYHHEVSGAVFQRVETRVNYAHPVERAGSSLVCDPVVDGFSLAEPDSDLSVDAQRTNDWTDPVAPAPRPAVAR